MQAAMRENGAKEIAELVVIPGIHIMLNHLLHVFAPFACQLPSVKRGHIYQNVAYLVFRAPFSDHFAPGRCTTHESACGVCHAVHKSLTQWTDQYAILSPSWTCP